MFSRTSGIRKFIRYRKFIRKVKDQLPDYHPQFGSHLEWNVYLVKTVLSYDTKTGKPIYSEKLPKLVIRQRCPSAYARDLDVYGFNWKQRRLYTVPNKEWR